MSKLRSMPKFVYISLILLIFYVPLFFLLVFSFNEPSKKGFLSFNTWNGTSFKAYETLFNSSRLIAFANSTIIAVVTVLIVTSLSLITVFALWRQKNKVYRAITDSTNNIPIINPDIITAVGLAIVFTILFGSLSPGSQGLWRGITSHVVMTLPYSILIMLPHSEKFNETLLKASYDLGYGKIKTWFKTYFVYMLMPMIFSMIVTVIFSFDDFILVRITSNVQTIGIDLFVGQFQPWALALGSLLLISVIAGNVIFLVIKFTKRNTNKSKINKKFISENGWIEKPKSKNNIRINKVGHKWKNQ